MDEKKYFITQKLLGVLVLLIGAVIPVILDGDATMSLFFVPLGLYVILTKKHVLTDGTHKFECEEEPE